MLTVSLNPYHVVSVVTQVLTEQNKTRLDQTKNNMKNNTKQNKRTTTRKTKNNKRKGEKNTKGHETKRIGGDIKRTKKRIWKQRRILFPGPLCPVPVLLSAKSSSRK